MERRFEELIKELEVELGNPCEIILRVVIDGKEEESTYGSLKEREIEVYPNENWKKCIESQSTSDFEHIRMMISRLKREGGKEAVKRWIEEEERLSSIIPTIEKEMPQIAGKYKNTEALEKKLKNLEGKYDVSIGTIWLERSSGTIGECWGPVAKIRYAKVST